MNRRQDTYLYMMSS